MRLTVIPDDQTIILDGEALQFQFPADASIHAVQWYGEYGTIEFRRGAAEHLSDAAELQPFVDAFRAEKARKTMELKPTLEQSLAQLNQSVHKHLNTAARAKGYGTPQTEPIVSACSFAGYPNEYQSEALAFGQWRSAVWKAYYQIEADVMAQRRVLPSEKLMLAELPKAPV